METTRFNPSDYISFIEYDEQHSGNRAVAFIVKVRPGVAKAWTRRCDRFGRHRLRELRDIFALALADALLPETRASSESAPHASASVGAAGAALRSSDSMSMQEHWTEIERESERRDAAAPNSDSNFGF